MDYEVSSIERSHDEVAGEGRIQQECLFAICGIGGVIFPGSSIIKHLAGRAHDVIKQSMKLTIFWGFHWSETSYVTCSPPGGDG